MENKLDPAGRPNLRNGVLYCPAAEPWMSVVWRRRNVEIGCYLDFEPVVAESWGRLWDGGYKHDRGTFGVHLHTAKLWLGRDDVLGVGPELLRLGHGADALVAFPQSVMAHYLRIFSVENWGPSVRNRGRILNAEPDGTKAYAAAAFFWRVSALARLTRIVPCGAAGGRPAHTPSPPRRWARRGCRRRGRGGPWSRWWRRARAARWCAAGSGANSSA